MVIELHDRSLAAILLSQIKNDGGVEYGAKSGSGDSDGDRYFRVCDGGGQVPQNQGGARALVVDTRAMKIQIVALALLLSSSTYAGQNCRSVFTDFAHPIDAQLAAKYPAMRRILLDPKGFVATMRARFNAEKQAGRDPLGFDYSDVSREHLATAIAHIDRRVAQLEREQARVRALRSWRLDRGFLQSELDWNLIWLGDMRDEAMGYLSTGQITYRQSVEFFNFLERSLGHYQIYQSSLRERLFILVNRRYLGYWQSLAHKEYITYRERRLRTFSATPLAQGFKWASTRYARDFAKAEELVTLLVPAPYALDRNILMRLMPHKIGLIGLIDGTLAGDGLVFTAGDMGSHDRLHDAGKYAQLQRFMEIFRVSPTDVEVLEAKQEEWDLQLLTEQRLITDANLRAAVETVAFIHHHDRGFPLSPYLWFNTPQRFKMYELVLAIMITGQKVGFDDVAKNLGRAVDWLNVFWRARQAEEEVLLKTPQS